MLSSSSSDTSNPQTPTGARAHNLKSAAAGELSPPGSQGPPGQDTPGPFGTEDGRGTRSMLNTETAKNQATDKGSSVVRGEPGASWMNKKAEDEYKRASEHLVDQEFRLGELSRRGQQEVLTLAS